MVADDAYAPFHSAGASCVTAAAMGAAVLPTLSQSAVPVTGTITTLIARMVGWVVIAGSTIRSLPQILRIVRKKSVDGLSMTSFVSELMAYIITTAYNVAFRYPFSTWGDTFMSAIQHTAIVGLIFHHDRKVSFQVKFLLVVLMLAFAAFLFSGVCSPSTYKWMQGFSAALLALGGRLPQVMLNLRRGNSGELSIISTALSVAGNAARVFTTIALVGDPIILFTATSQLLLNGILLFQTLDTARQNGQATLAAAAS